MKSDALDVILVTGTLDRPAVDSISAQLHRARGRNRGVVFVIDSNGGEFTKEFQALIATIRATKMLTVAKIYTAASCACLIALACQVREIDEKGLFVFHRGVLKNVSSAHIWEGKLMAPILMQLKDMEQLVRELLLSAGVELSGRMKAILFARGEVPLTAAECLTAKIVQRIT